MGCGKHKGCMTPFLYKFSVWTLFLNYYSAFKEVVGLKVPSGSLGFLESATTKIISAVSEEIRLDFPGSSLSQAISESSGVAAFRAYHFGSIGLMVEVN